MESSLQIMDWGSRPYNDALADQQAYVRQVTDQAAPPALIFTEHPPVYTVGARHGAENHLIAPSAWLEQEGITVCPTNRGGDITYHGPGQIVGYLIVPLADRDLHAHLRRLESALIAAVAPLGITAGLRPGKTGIWVGTRKLAAIGVAVKRWVTYHGFALNVSCNLRHFQGIIACGITDGTTSSLQAELGQWIDPETVKASLAEQFRQTFA